MPIINTESCACIFCGKPTERVYDNHLITYDETLKASYSTIKIAICNTCVTDVHSCSLCSHYIYINEQRPDISTGFLGKDNSVFCFDCFFKKVKENPEEREFILGRCALCGTKHFASSLQVVRINGKRSCLCVHCANKLQYCDICKEPIVSDHSIKVTGSKTIKQICRRCYNHHSFSVNYTCPCCNRIIINPKQAVQYPEDSASGITGTHIVCKECFEKNQVKVCILCNKIININKMVSFEYYEQTFYLCDEHIIQKESYTPYFSSGCPRCSRGMEHTFTTYSLAPNFTTQKNDSLCVGLLQYTPPGAETDITLCYDCLLNKNYGIIKRYGYKPPPKFKQVANADEPTLFLGVENEVNFPPSKYPEHEVNKLFDITEEHYYIKRDGSLDNGFEIVTHPCHFEYFKSDMFPMDKLFNENLDYAKPGTLLYDDDDDDDDEYGDGGEDLFEQCGMHIHLSKVAFSNAHLYKFMRFFLKNESFIEKMAGRKANSYCPKIMSEELRTKALTKSGGARDQVNCQPDNTVEVRVFQGAVTPEVYLRNIEFVYSLFKFTKLASLLDISVDNYKQYVRKHATMYPYLAKFI